MNNTPLKDHASRERIRGDLDHSLLVEAAAGTGKTTLLIERILNLVLDKKADLSKIAAITFTRKAAGELKQRLRMEIEKRIREHPAGEPAARLREALAESDRMSIGTIDSFCLELIRQLPVEAGVDPDVRVQDAAAESAFKDEFWNDWLSDELARECTVVEPFLALDFPVNSRNREISLRSLFDDLTSNTDSIHEFHVEREDETLVSERLERIEVAFAVCERLAGSCSDAEDKLLRKFAELRDWMTQRDASDLTSLLGWLADFEQIKAGRLGRQEAWGGKGAKQEFVNSLSVLGESVEAARDSLFSGIADPLVQWLKQAALEFTRLKLERGTPGFHDLLVIARNLLRDNRTARSILKARYTHLLVDEYQDTDPLQTEIIFYLCERAKQFAQVWEEVAVEPGKLFIVGDPKQSIYRFRRADLDLYGKVVRKLRAEGAVVTISTSFRGVKPLVGEINSIFTSPMSPDADSMTDDAPYQPEYVAMEPVREPHSGCSAVDLLVSQTSSDGNEGNGFDEAAAIAAQIRALVDGGRLIEDHGEWRPVRYGDIGVLLRQWTHGNKLERELRAREIPFETSTGRFFSERAEILALRSLLSAIDNPFDEMNVVGALRSSLLACSDEELLMHRANGGAFNYMQDTVATGHLAGCMKLLLSLHERKRDLKVSELIQETLDHTRGAELLALKPQGESRIENLNRLLSLARAMDSDTSLGGFIRLLEDETFLEAAGESGSATTGVDCVHVLSFHKAKGLEFPVVFIYGLGSRSNRSSPRIYDRETGKYAFAFGNLRTIDYELKEKAEKLRQEAEEVRLLYVAMTRARDLLVLPVVWDEVDEKSPLSFKSLLAQRYPRSSVEGTPAVRVDTASYDLDLLPLERLAFDFDRPFEEAEAEQARRRHDLWQQQHASAVNRHDHRSAYGRASAQEASQVQVASQSAGEGARQFGSFVHAVLERISFPDGGNLREIAGSLHPAYALTEAEADEAVELIRRALQGGELKDRLAQADRIFRELPYSVELNGVLFSGAMDLVLVDVDGAVIIDYKTNRNTDRAHLISNYGSQCGTYAQAFESAARIPVREVILYALRSGEAIALSRSQLGL